MKQFILCLFVPCFLSVSAVAQQTVSIQPELGSPGLAYALARYDSATVESQHLYNGPQYFIYDSPAEEHQFFLTEEWQRGSVEYDGQFFRSVPMLYDIFKDQLAIKYTRGFGQVALQMEKVAVFSFSGHRFIQVAAAQPGAGGLRPGFYDVLYEGDTRVLARRVKERVQQISDTKITILFPEKDVFYLLKEGKYHVVHSRASVLTQLEDQKKALKKYLRQQNLSFRLNREEAIQALAAHYDQLTRP